MSRVPIRNPKKEELWRSRFAEFQASGLSAREFCRQRSLTETSFYLWRKRLRQLDGSAPQPHNGSDTNHLIPVAVVHAGLATGSDRNTDRATLEIETPNGFRLRFSQSTNPETIAQLLDVISRKVEGVESC